MPGPAGRNGGPPRLLELLVTLMVVMLAVIGWGGRELLTGVRRDIQVQGDQIQRVSDRLVDHLVEHPGPTNGR